MASNPLIGTWKLISWENRSLEDSQVSYPLGEDATGYIMYNEDGYMFVAIMAPNRLRFAADDLLSATDEPISQLDRRRPRTPGRSKGKPVDVEHATAITHRHPADCSPDLGARFNLGAVDSWFTEVQGRILL